MALNYSTLVSEIATLTVISSTTLVSGDNNFAGIFDAAIDYSEGRIYRDLDLPYVRVISTAVTVSSGVRQVNLSTAPGEILAIETINLFTPVTAGSSVATRVPLVPASQGVVDMVYPSAASSNCAQPEFFARISNSILTLGPAPDQSYGTEIVGTIRPSPLSAGNSSTWVTQNYPELMTAATMVFVTGYMRDFGAQSDNPQMALSWENQYQQLLGSAKTDTFRQKFMSDAWTSQQPSPLATPPRA
jgi:hypothetical protein